MDNPRLEIHKLTPNIGAEVLGFLDKPTSKPRGFQGGRRQAKASTKRRSGSNCWVLKECDVNEKTWPKF